MKVFVIGCGSIGERHIKNLQNLSLYDISSFDSDQNRLTDIKKKYNIDTFNSLDKGLSQNPDLVLICTPPSNHLLIANQAIKYDTNIFIEKPISNKLEDVDELLNKAEKKKKLIFVGYNWRFNKGIKLLKNKIENNEIGKIFYGKAEFGQYLPDWRPWQDYKKSYTAREELGGGIILDGSHEIDYINWFLGEIKEVSCFAHKLSNLKVNVEDVADIILKFKKNKIGSIHLDFIRKGYSRNCTIIGDEGTLYFDYADQIVYQYLIDENKTEQYNVKTDPNEMYIEEMKHVLDCIKNNKKTLIDGKNGKMILEIALAAKKSAKIGEIIKL